MRKVISILLSTIYCFLASKIGIQFYLHGEMKNPQKLIAILAYVVILLLILLLILKIIFKKLNPIHKNNPKYRKKQLRKKTLANIVLLLSCVCLFIVNGLYGSTNRFLTTITDSDFEPTEIQCYVYVKKDSDIKTINDPNITHLGLLESDKSSIYTLLRSELEKVYNQVLYVDYQIDFLEQNALYDSLKDNSVQAMILSKAANATFETTYSTFHKEVRLLEIITIKTGIKSMPVNVTKEPFNVLIIGVDIRPEEGDIYSKTRMDTLMLASFNPSTMEMQLTSIPRDSYVPFTCDSNRKDKITHVGNYGIGCAIETIEDLLDVDINYYAKFNFDALVNIINALDGVTVDVKYSFTESETGGGVVLTKGPQVLNGEEALAYARHRRTVDDHYRNQAQQDILSAIINKLTSFSVITKFDNLLKVMQNNMVTNMTRKEIYSLATIVPKMSKLSNQKYVISGIDELRYIKKYDQELYITLLDESSIYEAREGIKKIMDVDSLHKTID